MKKHIITALILLFSLNSFAQKQYFHSISDRNSNVSKTKHHYTDSCTFVVSAQDTIPMNMKKAYSDTHEKSMEAKNKKKGNVLRLYSGESHELTMANLLEVMEEVGISNRIIVLAQSILETGFYTSNVCKNYNNLFGLYDSRRKDYYRFERWEDSVVGYQKFIQYRYKSGNYFAFLKRIGYAEDPQYIKKVAKITKKLCEKQIL